MATKKVSSEVIEDRQCAYREVGVRCPDQGHLSRSVRGGPWYCGPHFGMVNGWTKQDRESRAPEHMLRIREILGIRPEREPGEDLEEAR